MWVWATPFEPDHLLAVSTLITHHDRLRQGRPQGLGRCLRHTTMLVLLGSVSSSAGLPGCTRATSRW
ncbi:hypothetical protein QMK33_15710 [Hymenobacter sp. H14-R3]|uniref:hypothetical protein n=1 Tax=Hymenobacter sp. H14-R3 TaxID=3046308 RepID=UPI0024B94E26|nr:hypothetical protein [Hymenobacter sp. H14-R3]MDJ0366603.1 hypothetical protein [Hymenobacter sp. H14-R3]